VRSNDHDKFQQRVFDELADLEHADKQRIIVDFV